MPHGKPRVYFTCHPDDLSRFFDKICEDIWKTHDCVIYYTDDMLSPIPEKDRELELDRMNLFIVPVTYKLLSEKNRAMDEDIAYAKKAYIPVLPFMMEPGLDALYSRPDFFGEAQYINPYPTDPTEISYTDKLKKYLESVLISDEMAARVRAAFDTYIFLSYRKKDRKHANELMRIIHSRDEFRDIAIWYDEFLTPGESFKENIDKMLRDSKLFTLLVTPNLLEDGNFVMTNEYPEAKRLGMDILPAEMEKTDRKALKTKYDGIPDCADPRNAAAFHEKLLPALSKIINPKNDLDPEHIFLIGLAYLDGIDVEVDRARGLALIESAASAGLLPAMEKLRDMYKTGTNAALDYRKALEWAQAIVNYHISNVGKKNHETIKAYIELTEIHFLLGDTGKALKISEETYDLCLEVLGEDHPDTLIALENTALSLDGSGKQTKNRLKIGEKVYESCARLLGKDNRDSIIALINYSAFCREAKKKRRALKLSRTAYDRCLELYGEENADTIYAELNLAVSYCDLKKYKKALEMLKELSLRCVRVLGETHYLSMNVLNQLALTYGDSGDADKELELFEKAYALHIDVLDKDHPNVLTVKSNLAFCYGRHGKSEKALEMHKEVWETKCRIYGKEHYETIGTLKAIINGCKKLGDARGSYEYAQRLYFAECRAHGEENFSAIKALLLVSEKCFRLRDLFGMMELSVLTALRMYSVITKKVFSKKDVSQKINYALYSISLKHFGEKHPATKEAKKYLHRSIK